MSYFRIRIAAVIALILAINAAYSQSDFYNSNNVREVRIYFSEGNWDEILDSLHEFVGEDGRLKGDVMIDGTLYRNIGVRYKGYSSYDPDAIKSPFNIDLEYNFNNQNHQGYTKIKLSNVIQDPSFVREVLSYEIARKYVPASYANFANVYVNDTLIGLYTNVEAVDKNFVDSRFGSRDHTFFKGAPVDLVIPDGNNANLAYYDDDTNSYKPYYKLESDDSRIGWTDLTRFIDVLNNDSASISSVLDIDRALWMHALNYTLVNLDSYIGYSQNYYLYLDDHFRFNTIVWDFNMSFGSFRETDGITAPPGGLTILKRKMLDPLRMCVSTPMSPRPLIVNLLKNSTHQRMLLAHMRTIIDENFRNGWYYSRGVALQTIIDSFVYDDPNKFYPYTQFHSNMDTTVGSGNNVFPGLRDFMEGRMGYLDSLYGFLGAPVIDQIEHAPEVPAQGEELWIVARITGAEDAMLGYRYASKAPFIRIMMFDDGNHHDGVSGDSVYGAGIPTNGATVQYYIYAQNDSAGIFAPERAEYEFFSVQPQLEPRDVVINEVLAINSKTAADQDEEWDAWVELYNNTGEDQNLYGLYLSDDLGDMHKWAFPDTVIRSNGFMVVWLDGEPLQEGLHTGFTADPSEGQIILSDLNFRLIDTLQYGAQINDKTYGRYPNGYGDFVYMIPSFARLNMLGTTPLSDVLLYPCPAKDQLMVEVNAPRRIEAIRILDAQGRQVVSFNVSSANVSATVIPINIAALNDGLFLLKIETSEGSVIKKFIVCN